MTRKAWRASVRLLRSAGFATLLLLVAGVWAMAGTLVPQDTDSAQKVVAWARAHPVIEPVVGLLGLHRAFSSPVFIACVAVLGVSTALCAWQRTKLALRRARAVRTAAATSEGRLAEKHDLEIACDPDLSGQQVLGIAAAALRSLGIRTRRRGTLVTAVSPAWSVWGSPLFHWALVALIVAILIGSVTRSEGLMGVPVGQTKADTPAAYGVLRSGPLHNWNAVHRQIRVDALDLDFRTGGIDRGPTPAVSVLDGAGRVIKTQPVYPNSPLQTGTLTIHPSNYGLSVAVSLTNGSGVETGRSTELVDFSQEATDGTVPVGLLTVSNAAGSPLIRMSVTVPLNRKGGQFEKILPSNPKVRVIVMTSDGKILLERIASPEQVVALPTGDHLRVGAIGYYVRLSVVDDWTIPLLYAGLVLAGLGLTITVFARQQIIVATFVEESEGVKLIATVRLWSNASASRGEIESELTRTLSGADKGRTT